MEVGEYVPNLPKALETIPEKTQELMVQRFIWRTCLNCQFWLPNKRTEATQPESCGKYHVTPPAKVLVHGCKDWVDDVPF